MSPAIASCLKAPTFDADNIPTGWTAKVSDSEPTIGADFTVYAICA